jgi:hypothetical protein
MRTSECGALALGFLVEEWSRCGIASVRLRTDTGPEELATFIEILLDLEPRERDPGEQLAAELVEAGVRGVVVEPMRERVSRPPLVEQRRDETMRSYLQGLRAFREVLRHDGFPDRTKIRRARRAVQGLVDRFTEDEAVVLTLAQIRGHDPRLFHHCLNVSVYAVAIGQRLGLGRRQLGDLGLAALFHDVGKTVELDEDSRLRSSARGARMLLEESAFHEGMLKAAIVAYEQSADYDPSGRTDVDHELHLFSRIIAIADCFECLTTQPRGAKPPCTAHEAFCLMQTRAGAVFDPLLLKVFVNALGIYPAGTLVELSTGEIGIVQESPSEPAAFDRPLVRILRREGVAVDDGNILDLADPEQSAGIVRAVPAHEVFASVDELLAAV